VHDRPHITFNIYISYVCPSVRVAFSTSVCAKVSDLGTSPSSNAEETAVDANADADTDAASVDDTEGNDTEECEVEEKEASDKYVGK
jgi:hypothetical protein